MSDVRLGHTFAQVTCCLLSKVLYSKDQEAIQPSADHISCNTKNYLLRKSLSFLVPTSLPGFVCRGWVDIFLFISFSTFAYRIRNCFSTISTKILVNRSYFPICGEFLSANFCESPIFSPYTVIYLLFQLSWLLVPCLTINFGDFLCDLFVELPIVFGKFL